MTDRLEHGVTLVRAYLATLHLREREVLERVLLQGQSVQAAAKAMGVPLAAVRRYKARAERAIRESDTIAKALPYLRMQDREKRTAEDRMIERIDRTRVA